MRIIYLVWTSSDIDTAIIVSDLHITFIGPYDMLPMIHSPGFMPMRPIKPELYTFRAAYVGLVLCHPPVVSVGRKNVSGGASGHFGGGTVPQSPKGQPPMLDSICYKLFFRSPCELLWTARALGVVRCACFFVLCPPAVGGGFGYLKQTSGFANFSTRIDCINNQVLKWRIILRCLYIVRHFFEGAKQRERQAKHVAKLCLCAGT